MKFCIDILVHAFWVPLSWSEILEVRVLFFLTKHQARNHSSVKSNSDDTTGAVPLCQIICIIHFYFMLAMNAKQRADP